MLGKASEERKCCSCGSDEKVTGQIRLNGIMRSICSGCLNAIVHAIPDKEGDS